MRKELRFVFDANISANNPEAKQDALQHLRAMKEPRAWIHEQISFDAELQNARKISEQECLRRNTRWLNLLNELD